MSMVAWRSPKPLVRVQILAPVQINKLALLNWFLFLKIKRNRMNGSEANFEPQFSQINKKDRPSFNLGRFYIFLMQADICLH